MGIYLYIISFHNKAYTLNFRFASVVLICPADYLEWDWHQPFMVSVCLCVCESVWDSVCVWACACMRAYLWVCVRECVWESVWDCRKIETRSRSRPFGSPSLLCHSFWSWLIIKFNILIPLPPIPLAPRVISNLFLKSYVCVCIFLSVCVSMSLSVFVSQIDISYENRFVCIKIYSNKNNRNKKNTAAQSSNKILQ